MPIEGQGDQVSATQADWSRETKTLLAWNPSRSLIASLRSYERWRERGGAAGWIIGNLAVVRHRFWSAVTGADIPLRVKIGGGLLMPHPNGIVIHPDSRIGPNCLLFQQVTLGSDGTGVPILGGHVDVGAGAKILGAITVGDHAIIGANAVVLTDVPAGATAVGVPARVIKSGPGRV